MQGHLIRVDHISLSALWYYYLSGGDPRTHEDSSPKCSVGIQENISIVSLTWKNCNNNGWNMQSYNFGLLKYFVSRINFWNYYLVNLFDIIYLFLFDVDYRLYITWVTHQELRDTKQDNLHLEGHEQNTTGLSNAVISWVENCKMH
jgi:hypothetical protein